MMIRLTNTTNEIHEKASDYCLAIDDVLSNNHKKDNSYEKAMKQRENKNELSKLLSKEGNLTDIIKEHANNISLDMCKQNKPLNRRIDDVKLIRLTKHVDAIIRKNNTMKIKCK